MGQSNAPGETIHRGKNGCRLVVTVELEFPDSVLKDAAPAWDKSALSLVRQMLDQGNLRILILEKMHQNVAAITRTDLVKVKDITVEAAP